VETEHSELAEDLKLNGKENDGFDAGSLIREENNG
jgi:hypothetical protein